MIELIDRVDLNFNIRAFDELFGKSIDEFFLHSDLFVDKIWSTRLERLAEPGGKSGLSESLTLFLKY